jgi:hypothetical protein
VRRALAVVAGVLAVAGPASAATGTEVSRLAAQAPASPAALNRLRSIAVVDGRPVDLARALRTASRQDLLATLRVLAALPANPPQEFPATAAARRILQENRFRGSQVPRPFHGALVWLGERFSPVSRAFHSLARHVPGGAAALAVLLAALVVLASTAVAGRIARRRGASVLRLGERAQGVATADPRQLEREADAAEAGGDAAGALRLRFGAGLLRLGRARVVPLRASLTSGEARRLVGLEEFDLLAGTFDEVVYGGRSARAEDAVAARERWPVVLRAKGVRG